MPRTVPKHIVELERQKLTHGIVHYLTRPIFGTFGKLRTAWVTSEKNGILSKIFGHPTKSANRVLSKKLIFGNPPSSAKRESSVIFETRRENRTLLSISLKIRLIWEIVDCQSIRRISSEIRLIWKIEHRRESQYLEI